MTPEQFCYWLQGFFELSCPIDGLSPTQIAAIRDHLNTVFNKVTPDRNAKPRVLTEEEIDKVFGKPVVKMDPFDRPDVYCAPVGGSGRIC